MHCEQRSLYAALRVCRSRSRRRRRRWNWVSPSAPSLVQRHGPPPRVPRVRQPRPTPSLQGKGTAHRFKGIRSAGNFRERHLGLPLLKAFGDELKSFEMNEVSRKARSSPLHPPRPQAAQAATTSIGTPLAAARPGPHSRARSRSAGAASASPARRSPRGLGARLERPLLRSSQKMQRRQL